MGDLKDYLNNINREARLIDEYDIINICYLIRYGLDIEVNGIKYVDDNIYPLYLDFSSMMICANYNSLINYCDSLSKSDELDRIALINYHIVFCLLHEFMHVKQVKEEQIPGVKELYDVCNGYISIDDSNKIVASIKRVIYNKLHDYFATEINANILAYEELLEVIDKDYRSYFIKELYQLLKRVYLDYDLYSMYKDELKLDVSNLVINLSLEDKIRNGVYLSLGELDRVKNNGLKLEKIINCKV